MQSLIQKRQWTAFFSPSRVVKYLFIMLLIISCHQFAILTWQIVLLFSSPDVMPQTIITSDKLNYAQTSFIDIKKIEDINLFGKPKKEANMPAMAMEITDADLALYNTLPVSPLNIKLVGVIASELGQDRSLAVVSDGNNQMGVGIGEIIFNTQAKVVHIMVDKIIIQRQGRNEVIPFITKEQLRDINKSRETNKPRVTNKLRDTNKPKDTNNSPIHRDNDPPPGSPTADQSITFSQAKEQILKNPASFADYVSISPMNVMGELSGYHINPGKKPELFSQVGFQPGDLVIAINGIDLRDVNESQKVMEQLDSLTSLTVTVIRNAQQQDINIVLGEE